MLTVGVIGGMGPAATVDFLRRVIATTPATRDQDHLHLIIDNDPSVPDRTAAVTGDGPDPSPQLAAIAQRLEAAGAEILVMPCNAAHLFAQAITSAVQIPLINWPAEVVDEVKRAGFRRPGLLGTTGTLSAGLYQDAMKGAHLEPIVPTMQEQDALMDAIYGPQGVKTIGTKGSTAPSTLARVATNLSSRGADVAVVVCTDLSALEGLDQLELPVPLVNAAEVVARRTVALAYPEASST
jgi:aspartate racemase